MSPGSHLETSASERSGITIYQKKKFIEKEIHDKDICE